MFVTIKWLDIPSCIFTAIAGFKLKDLKAFQPSY